MSSEKVFNKLREVLAPFQSEFPETGLSRSARIFIALRISVALEEIIDRLDEDPIPPLLEAIDEQRQFVASLRKVLPHSAPAAAAQLRESDLVGQTKDLFENAWTVYSRETYEHSVGLISRRLEANGLGRDFFKGKRCFDGGCGTGRFAVAMAQLGAAEVVAADIGTGSLSFAGEMTKQMGVGRISFEAADVTDLSCWESESFDVVVSNGVLHHAVETERGIREHFRILKSGGLMWMYLYGAGGIYWPLFDVLKTFLSSIPPAEVRRTLSDFGIREGLIYTFLDNVLAPIRKYYSLEETLSLIGPKGSFDYTIPRGIGTVDDTSKVMSSSFGRDILGPDGEIRILAVKK